MEGHRPASDADSASSSSQTRYNEPSGVTTDKAANKSGSEGQPELSRTASRQTRHEDIHFFSPDGELQRTVSRQKSGQTTHTQDPLADDFDFSMHLRHLLNKADKNGVKTRELGVTFKNLTVAGKGSGLAYGSSVTGAFMAIPSLPKSIAAARHPKRKVILDDFTGTVRPGEMLLVLGRPGSGCSSFLKTLSANTESFTSVEGTVSYDGITPKEMAKNHRGDVAYLPEDDHHLPHLTVNETLTFAAAARTPATGARVEPRKETIERKRDVLMSLFGLKHTNNTKVGNDVVRGVSGGERKRVSIAELLTTGAKIGCHDNSTRGLDASTAVEYCRALRIATDVGNLTTILSIYQAGEQLYELFDKTAVIYDGKLVYFGPMGEAVQYFKDMGYEPQPRQTSADFLVACTDPKGRFLREGFEGHVPKTADEFVAHWQKSELGKRAMQEAEEQLRLTDSDKTAGRVEAYRESAQAERVKRQSKASPYLISYYQMVRLAMVRRYQMQMNDLPTLAITTIAAIFQSIIIGSVYFLMPKDTSGFFSRGGVIFFAILYNSFTGMAEITNSYSQRPIVVRQRGFAMLRPSADALALNIVDVPFKFVTIAAFDIVLYFMVGLQTSASQFFVFLLFTFVVNLAMLVFFRMLSSINRAEPNATMMAGIGVLIIAIYVGYAIPRPSMRVWFRWLSYAQPVSFAFEALLTNEFRTLNVPCVTLIPQGAGYEGISVANQVCSGTQGATAGSAIVNGLAYCETNFGYKWSHTWRNFGFIWAYFAFFMAVNLISYEYQRDETVSGGVMLYKRGAAPPELIDAIEAPGGKGDEEKGDSNTRPDVVKDVPDEEKDKAADTLKAASDVFTWRHINYDIMIKGEPRRLLSDVSGYVRPGALTCLMGESGAGKTTLLNTLAQRVTTGVVTGDMLVNGKPLPISFQRQTGYVQQQDVHMATTTVREALNFSALLRQPKTTPKAEKLAYVEEIIKLLEMETYAEALVGEVGMGLNVEQRKRLTIGVELAAKPALLIFLDEPTSGLDSQSSWSIMMLLRKLADHGQAILATIHQPSSELFQVFDRLLLLQKGGKVVYFGDIGENSKTLLEYFHARTDKRCEEQDNPAEYILDVIGAGAAAKADKDWSQLWNESDNAKKVQEEIDHYHDEKKNEASQADESPDSGLGYAAPLGQQFWIVTARVFQHYNRDPTYVMSKVMLNIVAGLFIGFSFWKAPTAQSGLQDRLFGVFMAVVLSAPLSQQLQPKFLGLRQLYIARESPSRMYSWPIFVISSILVEIPWNILSGTLFWCCWYFTVGFPRSTNRAGYAWLMHMFFEVYFPTFAQAVAAFSPTAMAASVLFSTLFSFVIIFNGVVQPVSQLPYFWRSWMYRLTPFTYLIEGLVSNALGGIQLHCTQSEFQRIVPPSGEECVSWLSTFTSSNGGYAQVLDDGSCGYCTYSLGDQYLSQLGMSFSHRWRDLSFMVAYICFNIFACFLAFYLFSVFDWSKLSGKGKKSQKKSEQKNTQEKQTEK
ncbi:hypothetical protein JCM10207_006055 [Rhodosporidiobolus poonsookiae]